MRRRKIGGDHQRDGLTNRMTPAASADLMAIGIQSDVVNDVVIMGRTAAAGHLVEVQGMANLPRHDMVGAGGIAAHPEAAQKRSVFIVQSQPATKDIDAANFFADHWVVLLAIMF